MEPGVPQEDLLERLRAGESAAFEEVVRQHLPRLRATVRRLVGSDADADEVVQEAFLNAFRNLGSFRGDARLGTWLHRIAVNAALSRRRHDDRTPEGHLEGLVPEFSGQGHLAVQTDRWRADIEKMAAQRETRAAVRRMIDQLPEPHRTVLILRDIEELSTQEASEALGISVPAVKTRLHRARMALKTLIEREVGPQQGDQ